MKHTKYFQSLSAVTVLAALLAAVPAGAAVLRVNVGPDGLPTETGFTNWTTPGDNETPSPTTVNGIGLTVDITVANPANEIRSINRTNTYNGTLGNLTQTWWGVRASPNGGGGQFSIIVNGSDLGAGIFEWTSWHHDHDNQTGPMDIEYSVNGGANFTVAFSDFDIVDNVTDGNIGAPNPATFSFTSNGTDDIHIRFTNVKVGTSGSNNTFALVNGFQIGPAAPPPPSTITYIDADITEETGNTVLEGGGSSGPTGSTTVTADGLWSIRTRDGVNGGGVLATHSTENAEPRLVTTFTLPEPGLYTIYGYCWNNAGGTGNWDAEFQLGTVRAAVLHDKTNATNLGFTTNHFTDPLVPNAPPLPPGLPDDAILIQTDGAWSWFNDHTARFVNGDLYIGYVKCKERKMAMTRYDFDTETAYEFLLGTQPSNDDHDVPNVTVLPDRRILSLYSRHRRCSALPTICHEPS